MIVLHQKQREINLHPSRFKVIRAGRRSGKTVLCEERSSFKGVEKKDRQILYIAKTKDQARNIIWEQLKTRLIPIGAKFNESRWLEVKVPTQDNGWSLIRVSGWENRETHRGNAYDHITFDETDSLKNFFTGWQEIFRPTLMDRNGTADFIGTPDSAVRNLQRMEKEAETDIDYANFHFTSYDNPYLSNEEIEKARVESAFDTFQQEYLAEYVDFQGALFNYGALVDVFSNTVDRTNKKYLIVDIADDGSDRTIFSFWDGMVEYKRIAFERLNTEQIIEKIREFASADRIPYSNIAVDAIGVGAGVASSSLLDGIIGYKSSYQPIKTDKSIIEMPNTSQVTGVSLVSDFRNLRSQCTHLLANYVNNHRIASEVEGQAKEHTIEELHLYQDVTKTEQKRMVTPKKEVEEMLGRSPDDSDTWIMRMYFEIRQQMAPQQSEEKSEIRDTLRSKAIGSKHRQSLNSSR